MKNDKQEKFHLWWVDTPNKNRYYAGVAFREHGYGEYRLKVDCYPDRRLYLKDFKTENDKIFFRVEENKKIGGRNIRYSIGEAYSNETTNGNIEMVLSPAFSAKLVMSFGKKKN